MNRSFPRWWFGAPRGCWGQGLVLLKSPIAERSESLASIQSGA